MEDIRSIRDDLNKILESKFIVEFGLIDKATQVLLKLIGINNRDPEKFVTFAELRRNFRSITTDEVYAITGEFEKLRLVESKIVKTKLVVRFNLLGLATNGFDQMRQEKLQNYIREKDNKRAENARKVLEEIEQRQRKTIVYSLNSTASQQTSSEPKTPFELHRDKECDSAICRFCAIEQDKAIGF